MPELPEVETLTRQLRSVITGKKIAGIEILRAKSFQGNPGQLIGQTINALDRKAKVIILHFKRDFPKLLIHLKMTGQLVYQDKNKVKGEKRIVGGHPTADWVNELPSKHTRVIITFTDKSVLFFNDQRVFGWLKVISDKSQLEKELASFTGLDPLSPGFTGQVLKKLLGNSRKPVKLSLFDQSKIAGIGNIYANDALFLAGIDPRRNANAISLKKWQALADSIKTVLEKGIAMGGASETNYVHVDGLGGSYQNHFFGV